MVAQVRFGKKGRYQVVIPDDYPISQRSLLNLAHELSKIHGVKRALVRKDGIYGRVNAGVRGLRHMVYQTVSRFFSGRRAPRRPQAYTNAPPHIRGAGRAHRTPRRKFAVAN